MQVEVEVEVEIMGQVPRTSIISQGKWLRKDRTIIIIAIFLRRVPIKYGLPLPV